MTTKGVSDKVEEAANNKYKDEGKDCSESERMILKTKKASSSGLRKPYLTKMMYKKGEVRYIRDRRGK
jgi:hypothetical protein